ncbi:unnamed protein product [Psylliodes chrysocephalus]|uniref:Myb-like domain-containing protein n=1 Tax=Psylliodes chrysocephalus TaxID=3402493 RepID=A0A9P0GCS7_9CUCU|nr:unnamed protein product [Psylliodes chrysocephala]
MNKDYISILPKELVPNQHVLVREEVNGDIGEIIKNEEGHLLMMDLQSQTMYYLPPTSEILRFFNIEQPALSEDETKKWSREEILKLINIYKIYESSFKNTSIKNEKVWQRVSKELGTRSSEQCKNKFKYLKGKYVEKKENMSSKASGSKVVKFDFFNEFEELFAHHPNIQPQAVASSSRGEDNVKNIMGSDTNVLNNETKSDTENKKKRKRSMLEKQLDTYEDKLNERERNKERRHQDIMRKQDEALDVFKNIASSFEKFVNNN